MALKFLNKKGWHTGSLRNVERVWKAEQKHDAEQRKLEELRKQIEDEREKSEFRLLQEQAGLVPRQERLEFLYDSGLAVGKGSSSSAGGSGVAFKALEEAVPSANRTNDAAPSSAAAKQPSAPGALFEDKPHSANDAWRKLHSDPLLLIRQQEQQALARVKNNPVQMALIRKSMESKKEEKTQKKKEHQKRHSHESAKDQKHSTATEQPSSKDVHGEREKTRYTDNRRSYKYDDDDDDFYKEQKQLDEKASKRESHRRRDSDSQDTVKKTREMFVSAKHSAKNSRVPHLDITEVETGSRSEARSHYPSVSDRYNSHKRRSSASKLSEEERAAKLREMQADAELHEGQRWKRLKKAEDDEARETTVGSTSGGRNFLAAAHRSVYGAGKGGSSTIEESVRRRTHYSQRGSEAGNGNAFRR